MTRTRISVLAIALAAALGIVQAACGAELRATRDGAPVFTAAEVAVIVRNEALAVLIADHPNEVRRALDALADVEAGGGRGRGRDLQDDPRPRPNAPSGAPAFDASANPDLNRLERATPEAVFDLFQLIKQAGATKPLRAPAR
jgi:hypothetical protein